MLKSEEKNSLVEKLFDEKKCQIEKLFIDGIKVCVNRRNKICHCQKNDNIVQDNFYRRTFTAASLVDENFYDHIKG